MSDIPHIVLVTSHLPIFTKRLIYSGKQALKLFILSYLLKLFKLFTEKRRLPNIVFTVRRYALQRRYALHGICDRNSVCPSVRLSVCHTPVLYQNEES